VVILRMVMTSGLSPNNSPVSSFSLAFTLQRLSLSSFAAGGLA
jgi:hypothetical protein